MTAARQNCTPLTAARREGCWDKPTEGRSRCWEFLLWSGHRWELNFYRMPGRPDHVHCWKCGIGRDR